MSDQKFQFDDEISKVEGDSSSLYHYELGNLPPETFVHTSEVSQEEEESPEQDPSEVEESQLDEESKSRASNALVDLTPEQIKIVDLYFKDLHKVLKKIRHYQGDINSFTNKHCCVFIGNTGAGKSCTVNGLIQGSEGMEDVVVSKQGRFGAIETHSYEPKEPLRDTSGQQVFDVSASVKSCTKYISSYSHESVLYCDCPGFEDTEGVATDTANAILIGRLFQASSTVTLVVVIDYHSVIVNRGTILTQLMKTVTQLLEDPSQMAMALERMIFCVTKAPESTKLAQVKEELFERLAQTAIPEDTLENIIANNVFVINPTDSLPASLGTKMADIKQMITHRQLYLDADLLKMPMTIKMQQNLEKNLAEGQRHVLTALQSGDVSKAKAIIAIFDAMSKYIPNYTQAVDMAQAYIHQYEKNLLDKEKGEQMQAELMEQLFQQEELAKEQHKQQQQILAQLEEQQNKTESFQQIIQDEQQKRAMLDEQFREERIQAEEQRKEQERKRAEAEEEHRAQLRQLEEQRKEEMRIRENEMKELQTQNENRRKEDNENWSKLLEEQQKQRKQEQLQREKVMQEKQREHKEAKEKYEEDREMMQQQVMAIANRPA